METRDKFDGHEAGIMTQKSSREYWLFRPLMFFDGKIKCLMTQRIAQWEYWFFVLWVFDGKMPDTDLSFWYYAIQNSLTDARATT